MSIDPTRSGDVRPSGHEKAAEIAGSSDGTPRASERVRGDQVEISAEARSLAEQGDVERVPFTEARAAEVRERLDSGFYEGAEVIRRIAERIVDSGDL